MAIGYPKTLTPAQVEQDRLRNMTAGINQPGIIPPSGLVAPQTRPLATTTTSVPGVQTMAPQMRPAAAPTMPQTAGLVQPTPVQAGFLEVNPIYRTVADNETVRGQLNEIMANDSPLLQRARARAQAAMQGSGLLNSSMAIGAGEGAMYDVAVPIASADAQIRSQAADRNVVTGNETQQFNATQFGRNQEFNANAQNQFGLEGIRQSGEDRRQQVSESGLNTRQQVTERGLGDRLNIQEGGLNTRAREQNKTQLEVTDRNNATQRYGVDVSAQTQRYGIDTSAKTAKYATDVGAATARYSTDVGASVSRENARLSADTARYTAGLSASTQQSIAQLANQAAQSRGGAELLNSAENRIAAIYQNPDIPPGDKQTYIQNQYNSVRQGLNLLKGVSSINLAVG